MQRHIQATLVLLRMLQNFNELNLNFLTSLVSLFEHRTGFDTADLMARLHEAHFVTDTVEGGRISGLRGRLKAFGGFAIAGMPLCPPFPHSTNAPILIQYSPRLQFAELPLTRPSNLTLTLSRAGPTPSPPRALDPQPID